MNQSEPTSVEHDQRDDLATLEELIRVPDACLDDARTVLRRILFSYAGIDGAGGTIGDALAALAKQPSKNAVAAIVILRCLAVRNVFPVPNSVNQIIRHTVTICEGALSEIVDFLQIDKRSQNYKKFELLSCCHHRITEILNPLRAPYADVDALLNARKEIIGCLNHSIVRIYAGPYRLSEVRTTIESLFSKLKKVSATDPTFLVDIEECNRAVRSVRAELDSATSFLNRDFLAPFLDTYDTALSRFLDSLRGRFATAIMWGGGPSRELQKKYPLHEPEREIHIVVPLRNSGPGMATNVRVTVEAASDHVALRGETIMLGNVLPGDFSVTSDAMIISQCSSFQAALIVEWGEIGNPSRSSEMFEFQVSAQSRDVDWQSLEYHTPYTTGVVQGDQFVGRVDKVRQLAAKLLRSPMEPFYITGQKRVGKTSLALAAAHFATMNSPSGSINCKYILWGRVAHVEPKIAVKNLGEEIENFILSQLDVNIQKGDYNGSLSALIKLSELANKTEPETRFVIIIDEFDEIHQELFLQGNIAETFFGNLRALSRCDNICLVLVGGENMAYIMDRQGQKLNNFSRVNLSYFSRELEWSDFHLLVKKPAEGILNWHDDAVSEVFNITHGNPYFSKMICAAVFRAAVSERDADITADEVKRATEAEVSALGANSFAHLWQDGVPKAASERDPDILLRIRVLLALARCLRAGLSTTTTHIADHRTSVSLSEPEIVAVLNDFVRRDVLREKDRQYTFNLPVFQMWLVDVGVRQLIADGLTEELANAVLAQENAALVRSEEVAALARQWPTYRGRHIGSDEIRAWYQQVSSFRDQRLLFELLMRTRVYSDALVRERLRSAHALLRPSLPEFVMRNLKARRKDVLLTYVDGPGKSGASYAALYAEENGIAAECVIARGNFRSGFEEHVKTNGTVAALVIMDDIAATGTSLSGNVDRFLEECGDLLESVTIRVVTLVATKSAQAAILRKFEKMEIIDIDFRTCEILPSEAFAFPDDKVVWNSQEEEARAKALCVDIGSNIYKKSPLGYGGRGLLVVFPTTVPNNSLPILHTHAQTGSARAWIPLFPRVVN